MRNKSARVILAIAWIFGILFPIYVLKGHSSTFQSMFDWVFHTPASHVLMHSFLYATLGCILCSMISAARRSIGRAISYVLPIAAMVAISQEGIQMLHAHAKLKGDDIFDVVVDVNGAMLGVMLYIYVRHRRQPTRIDDDQNRPPAM